MTPRKRSEAGSITMKRALGYGEGHPNPHPSPHPSPSPSPHSSPSPTPTPNPNPNPNHQARLAAAVEPRALGEQRDAVRRAVAGGAWLGFGFG